MTRPPWFLTYEESARRARARCESAGGYWINGHAYFALPDPPAATPMPAPGPPRPPAAPVQPEYLRGGVLALEVGALVLGALRRALTRAPR